VKLLSGKCLGGEEDTIYAVARKRNESQVDVARTN
jgi:hypothetical protein